MKENLIKTEMNVNNEKISVMRIGNEEYISLTDLAKYANPTDPSGVIRNWMSNKNSFEFYSLWEELNNENKKLKEKLLQFILRIILKLKNI